MPQNKDKNNNAGKHENNCTSACIPTSPSSVHTLPVHAAPRFHYDLPLIFIKKLEAAQCMRSLHSLYSMSGFSINQILIGTQDDRIISEFRILKDVFCSYQNVTNNDPFARF